MSALIILHLQNDYLEGGSLNIQNSLSIVPLINRIKQKFSTVIFIHDKHPFDHISFKTEQKHCVNDTWGVQIHEGVDLNDTDYHIYKGTLTLFDSSSAFYNAKSINKETKLNRIFIDKKIKKVYLCGVRFEKEIFSTAIDAIKKNYETYVVEEIVEGNDDNLKTKFFLKNMGVKFISIKELDVISQCTTHQ